MPEQQPIRILVLNPKGGSGKTTIATNLASWYAHSGRQVSLMDYDQQGSSTHWLANRSAALPAIHAIPSFRHETPGVTRAFQFRLPFDTSRVIIDTPAGAPNNEVRRLLRLADVVVVPVLPSPIDIHAAAEFIRRVEKEREHRPIALVANRVRDSTRALARLQEFLGQLPVPVVATLRDLQIYVQCAEAGQGICDVDARAFAREREALSGLAAWIDDTATRIEPPPHHLPAPDRTVPDQPIPDLHAGSG